MTPETFRIVAVDPLPQKYKDIFHQQIPSEGFQFLCPDTADAGQLTNLVRQSHALVTRHRMITADIISAAGTGLRLIQVMGRLPDRVDLEAATASGVPVAVMPHGGAIAVAEHAFALMLALARKLVVGHKGVVAGGYRDRNLEPSRTTEWKFAFNWLGYPDLMELRGKTLGLIGLGEIGREVARRARIFEMEILYHQRHRIPERFEDILGVRMVTLDELLGASDIVSLHVPHTDETEQLIDGEKLSLMKRSAFLVNTGRGGLVDETAMVNALREGRIAGAGLDVFEQEPLPADHPLCGLENVVLAPHTGGGAGGGQKKLIGQVIENIARVAAGDPPVNLVT